MKFFRWVINNWFDFALTLRIRIWVTPVLVFRSTSPTEEAQSTHWYEVHVVVLDLLSAAICKLDYINNDIGLVSTYLITYSSVGFVIFCMILYIVKGPISNSS